MKITAVLFSALLLVFCSPKRQNKIELSKDDGGKFKVVIASYTPNGIPTVENEKYVIDKKESVITWKGSMVFASQGGHTGYINVSKGELMIEKSQLAGGTVDVDMNSIADEIHSSENELVRHLKSPDFFDAGKFPFSSFIITKIAPSYGDNITITGNLTIKGITHEIAFDAKVNVAGGVVIAKGKMTIDRTQWDVIYKSGKFYFNLADKAISDYIEFDIKIVARK
jgi:polyisoprenoid-binding protein YceI